MLHVAQRANQCDNVETKTVSIGRFKTVLHGWGWAMLFPCHKRFFLFQDSEGMERIKLARLLSSSGIDENDSCKHKDTSKERKQSRHFSKPDPGNPTCDNRNKIKKARSSRCWKAGECIGPTDIAESTREDAQIGCSECDMKRSGTKFFEQP